MQHQLDFKMRVVLLLAICGCCVSSRAFAAPGADDETPPIKATLLADTAAIIPGKPFTLGVLLEIRPGWHTYWLFPGDSGMKTRVKFEAPPGFTVGDLRYPTPRQFPDLDNAVVFGYSGSVLLTAVVTQLNDAVATGGKADFHATCSWLCCQNVCLPGTSKCNLSLPIAQETTPENRELFQAAQKSLPFVLGQSGCPAAGTASTERAGDSWSMTVDLQWHETPHNVEFFPAPDNALKITDLSLKNDGRHTLITFKAQTLQGMSLSSPALMAVVARSDEHGARRGVQVHFDLK